MSKVLQLRGKQYTYKSASDEEFDFLTKVEDEEQTSSFIHQLPRYKQSIELLTAHHLRLSKAQNCVMSSMEEWRYGRFNVCIPVAIQNPDGKAGRRVAMRIAMSHMTAESAYPGTVDEKLRCEIGAYVHVQEDCPEIPTKHLFGFGFSNGTKFTHSKHLPFLSRFIRQIKRRFCNILQLPVPSQYIPHPNSHSHGFAYSVSEYIESSTGSMLFGSWNFDRLDSIKRENFFRDHARIKLSLARKPVPRIGSFRFLDDGTISLSNRPLISSVVIMEKEGANRVIQTDETYDTVEPFISDLLACQEDRLSRKPNAVLNKRDCLMQMTALSLLRATAHHFMEPKSRYGPFHLCLTDDHQDQYLVDKNCHITHVIDLEFVCSLPTMLFTAPYWLTGYGVDQLYGQRLEEYNELRQQYMRLFEEEEEKLGLTVSLAQLIIQNWNDGNGSCWLAYCLTSIDAAFNIFEKHIRPMYHRSSIPDDVDRVVSHFFVQGSESLMEEKIADKDAYDAELKKLFSRN